MPQDDLALLDGWVALRRAAFTAHPEYRPGAPADAHHRRCLTDALCRARVDGHVRALWGPTGLVAAIAAYPDTASWYGHPTQQVVIDLDPDAPHARRWVIEQAADLTAPADVDLTLMAAYRTLLDPLMALGLGIDSLILLGNPADALDRLIQRSDPPPIEHFGLTMGTLATVDEIDRIGDLERQIFSAHPEWCWFATSPLNRGRNRARRLMALSGDEPTFGGARRDAGRVIGLIEMGVERQHPLWDSVAGVGLVLEPAYWGRGLLKTMYRQGLAALADAGVAVFKGGTSQPPVLGLGKVMNRPLHAIALRRQFTFDRTHFQGYV